MAKTKKGTASKPPRNPLLWLLKYEVEDERFLQIMGDFAGLNQDFGGSQWARSPPIHSSVVRQPF